MLLDAIHMEAGMLQRKAMKDMESWRDHKTHQGLLVMGARQVGKTTLVREFAARHYGTMLEVNFFDDDRAVQTVAGARNSRDLFLRLSALGGKEIVPGDTLIFLDEIQECGDVLTWMKFLAGETGCDYVLSGSRLGLDAFDARSLPVGFLQTLEMYPLDFEEFCWAAGIGPSLTAEAFACFASRQPVADFLHERMMDAFYRYLLIGGMPDAVQSYVDRNDLAAVRGVQRAIFDLYESDIAKYVMDKVESRQIRMVYEAIPGQLNEANKRFKYTRLGKNLRFANMETAFDWVGSAGVALPVVKVSEPVFPLGLTADRSSFKLYMNDVGLLTSRLMPGVDLDILNRRSSINFGSIFENAAAQEYRAHGFELFYYNTAPRGEIDFVLETNDGATVLCEIKSGKDYRRHSAMNNLLGVANYGYAGAFVFCDGNVSVADKVTYLPVYMMGCLHP